MENYRKLIEFEFKIFYIDEEDKNYHIKLEALILVKKFLKQRFDNELKQYNNDELKAYDKFIAKRNINLLRYYVEEFYLLDKKPTDKDLIIRKEMRYIVNHLYTILNNN